jgi:hypothetical protein
VLRDLIQKRDKLAARAEQISDARKAIGYATFVDGDKAARKKLDALNVESGTIAGELEALSAAIAEGRRSLRLRVGSITPKPTPPVLPTRAGHGCFFRSPMSTIGKWSSCRKPVPS